MTEDSEMTHTMRPWDYIIVMIAIMLLGGLTIFSVTNSVQNDLIIQQNHLSIDQAREELRRLTKRVNEYDRDDHDAWCVETEKLNPGWKCAPLPDLKKDDVE